MHATSVVNLSLSNSLIISICFITLMTSPTRVHNVDELSKNCLHYKIMKEFIVVNGHLPVRHVEKVSGKESHILFTGKFCEKNHFLISGQFKNMLLGQFAKNGPKTQFWLKLAFF